MQSAQYTEQETLNLKQVDFTEYATWCIKIY